MRNLWALIKADPQTKHIFTVPCDSHGLQLLIKDILEEIEWFTKVFAVAQKIGTKFRTSPKQLSILQQHQVKKRAFIAAVITRWGTQLAMASSVKVNQEPIRAYAVDKTADVTPEFIHCVINGSFWQELDAFLYLFKPIHEAQKMSESDRAQLSKVPQRWLDIYAHLHNAKAIYPQAQEVLEMVFQERMAKQVVSMHWAAFYLDPINAGAAMSPIHQQQVIDFLIEHVPTNRLDAVQEAFFSYYNKEDYFHPNAFCWKNSTKPSLFWSSMRAACPELADTARRLYHTQANSVPSERSFSIGKLIHSRTRASTNPERVDRQTFIYINRRVLLRNQGMYVGHVDWCDLTEEERLEWEASIVENDYIERQRRTRENDD